MVNNQCFEKVGEKGELELKLERLVLLPAVRYFLLRQFAFSCFAIYL